MRKILKIFKTTPCVVMKIKFNLLPLKIHLLQKNQKYALQIVKLEINEFLCKFIPKIFFQNWQHQKENDDDEILNSSKIVK